MLIMWLRVCVHIVQNASFWTCAAAGCLARLWSPVLSSSLCLTVCVCCPCCGCCYSQPQAEWIKQGQDNERIRTIIQYNTGIFSRNIYTLKSKLLWARGRANVRHICEQYALSDSSGYYCDRAKEEIKIVEEMYRCIAGNDSMLFSLYHLHVSNLILYSSLLE